MEATANEGIPVQSTPAARTSPAPAQGPTAVAAPGQSAAPAKSRGRGPLLVLMLLGLGGVAGFMYHRKLTANEENTDDAEIEADVVPIAARAGGTVVHLHVQDNQRVHRGEVILELDPAESTARVAQAQAEVDTATAQLAVAEAESQLVGATAPAGLHTARASVTGAMDALRSAQAQVDAAEAGVLHARAMEAQTATTLARDRSLMHDGAIAQAELDNAQNADDAAQAALAQARAQQATSTAARQAAQSHIGEAQGRLEQSAPVDIQVTASRARADLARAHLRSAQAALQLAQVQLTYLVITAANDGVVSRLGVREGQIIQAGQAIGELVPNTTYLVANFKETQVGRMHAGQRVEATIDAYPGRRFEGRIESLSGGTGARFSMLPPDNASGNFVKVVQRVPVRIQWTGSQGDAALRAGLSADVTVFLGP